MERDTRAVPSGTALVLVLHAHLPWSLRRGAWPHGSDWVGEAVCEAYLPLAATLDALARDGVPVKWTLGITPVLAAQLTAPDAPAVLRTYTAQRLAAAATLRDDAARPHAERDLGAWWHGHYAQCIARLETLDWDVTRAFAAHVEAGRVELMGSAATHAVLPLLATDESVRLQLALGRLAHARTFGAAPRGVWLPECAYRPRGWWQPAPWAPSPRVRDGIDTFVREAGFAWTIVDAHLPRPVASVTRRAAAGATTGAAATGTTPTGTTPARRETRTAQTVLAAWAREIAAARAAGLLPPAVSTAPAPAQRADDERGVDGDDRDARPMRSAASGAAAPWRTSRAGATSSDALALATAILADGVPTPRPWPVFDDLEALLRAARSADAVTGDAIPGEDAMPMEPLWWLAGGRPDGALRDSGAMWDSGAFPLDSGAMWESGAFPLDSGAMWESGAFPLDSGAMWESGAFPRDSGAMWESGAFPLDSGAMWESGAFPRDSGAMWESGASPLDSGTMHFHEADASRDADDASPTVSERSRLDRDAGTGASHGPVIPFFDAPPATVAQSGSAPTTPVPLEGDETQAIEFVRAAAAPVAPVQVFAIAPTAASREATPDLALPPSWPHGLHHWRGPFVGAGVTTTGAWRDALRAVVPAIAHRPWRVASSLETGTADPTRALTVLVRDPLSARLVWSRSAGYPASAEYLEFHRRDASHGLRLWRVTSHEHGLGDKMPYEPAAATAAAARHAAHFAASLRGVADGGASVVVAPFDAELFGHWWREGPQFLAEAMRALAATPLVPACASEVVRGTAAPAVLDAGSWGALGSFAMWLNERTAWYWRRLWPLEHRFWRAVHSSLALPAWHPVLVQATRALLLAQASDWPFMLTRDEAADHATRRAREHLDACEALVAALEGADAQRAPVPTLAVLGAAARQGERDDLFAAADVLDALRTALATPPPPPDGGARVRPLVPPPPAPDATGDAGPIPTPAAA